MNLTRQKQYAITVPGSTESLSILRSFVMETARRSGLAEVEAGKLEIAACEACANIIEHGYRGDLDKQIIVRLRIDADRIEITILDKSKESFPVNELEIITLDDFLKSGRRRGLGTYIIRNFVDQVDHSFSPNRGNRLRLTKFC